MAIQKVLKFVKEANGNVMLYNKLNNLLIASFNSAENIVRQTGDPYRFKIAANVNDIGFVLDYRSIDSLLCSPVIIEANINDFLIELSKKFFFLDEKTNALATGICLIGNLVVFKRNGNIDKTKLENPDFAIGMVENRFIQGVYIGGLQTLLASFDINNGIDF